MVELTAQRLRESRARVDRAVIRIGDCAEVHVSVSLLDENDQVVEEVAESFPDAGVLLAEFIPDRTGLFARLDEMLAQRLGGTVVV
jgi:hypothetical protein